MEESDLNNPEEMAKRLKETRLPPELQEWARRQFTQEDFLRGVREIEEQGGVPLSDFFDELIGDVSNGRERP
jgi:hypothetical protein